jgi:hypothetical protein
VGKETQALKRFETNNFSIRRENMRFQYIRWLMTLVLGMLLVPGQESNSYAGRCERVHRRRAVKRIEPPRNVETAANSGDCTGKASEDKEKEVESGAKLLESGELSDGGTYYARIQLPSGEILAFGISSPDGGPMFPPNLLFVGELGYKSPKVRLVPPGSDEEKQLTKALEDALRPYLTKEGEEKIRQQIKEWKENNKLPPPPGGAAPFGVESAKGLLHMMQKLGSADRKK